MIWRIIWIVVALLFIFWLVGLVLHIAAALIWPVLLVALALIVWNLFFARRNRI
jgi:hypothetical protein